MQKTLPVVEKILSANDLIVALLLFFGVIGAAFVGSLCGDQLFFFLGRRHSTFLLTRRPSWTRSGAWPEGT
mgnify:CR=1 FL=1